MLGLSYAAEAVAAVGAWTLIRGAWWAVYLHPDSPK